LALRGCRYCAIGTKSTQQSDALAGRLTAELIAIGYESSGVDVTPAMLTVAEQIVPDADFRGAASMRSPSTTTASI
jgi:hypothetical protein